MRADRRPPCRWSPGSSRTPARCTASAWTARGHVDLSTAVEEQEGSSHVVCAVSVLRQAMNEMLADEGTRLR